MSRQKFDITKVKHNEYLYQCILETGLTLNGFCEFVGLSETTLMGLLRLKKTPLNTQRTDYSKTCKIIAEALGLSCEDLFPFEAYGLERLDLYVEYAYCYIVLEARHEINTQRTPFDDASEMQLKEALRSLVYLIGPRKESMLCRYYGIDCKDMDMAELAAKYQLSTGGGYALLKEAVSILRNLRYNGSSHYSDLVSLKDFY